jgi:hypothetical protein
MEVKMQDYKFEFNNRTYELLEDNYDYFDNDAEEVKFDLEYYDTPCDKCLAGKKEKAKIFRFLEYHFFIFTKEGNYVISNISKEFKNTSTTQLFKLGKVDNSFIVSIAVCENCGSYSIEIEQCEV